MVNPLLPWFVSTAAFLVRTPQGPTTTTTTSLPIIRSTRADAFVRLLQSKQPLVDDAAAEEITEPIQQQQQQQDNREQEQTSSSQDSSTKSNLENALLDLLPTTILQGKYESDNKHDSQQQQQEATDNTSNKNLSLFDIHDQWKTAETDFSDFWSRIIITDGKNIEDEEEEEEGSNNGKSHNSGSDVERSGVVDISDTAATSSSTEKDALEEYGDKASQRHPNVPDEENNNGNNNNNNIMSSLGVTTTKILEPLEALLTNNNDNNNNDGDDKEEEHQNKNDNDKNEGGIASILKNRAQSWMGYLSLPGGGTEQSIQDMMDTARESAQHDGSDAADEKSFQEVLGILRQYSAELKETVDKYFADMDVSTLRPTSLFYYLEKEDEHKNPSWKRRMHRFYPGVGVERMNQLNDALTLARVAYMDSVEEAKERLESLTDPYELVYCNLVGEPNQPAHYVAVKQRQNKFSPALELVLGVRGTKTITDAVTDLLCEEVDYRGGKAHSVVLASGKYIAKKHAPLLQELLESSGKQRIKIKLVGHSLGAGAAAIAAMEFKDQPNIDVEVVGFGSPAMLSQELSEGMKDYMTTVVADDDVVPRLSAPTLINALLDVMEYDYIPSARRDIEQALEELQHQYPMIVTTERAENVMSDFVDPLLEKYVTPTINEATTERMPPLLLPPGEIFHLYRNSGAGGISGSLVPCTFFDKIDVRRNMIEDHLFHSGYERIFLDVMRLHYQDHSFQFENPVTPNDDAESS